MTNNIVLPNEWSLFRQFRDNFNLNTPIGCPDFGKLQQRWDYGIDQALSKAIRLASSSSNYEQLAIIYFHKGLFLFNDNNFGHAGEAFKNSYQYAIRAGNHLFKCLTLFAQGLVEHHALNHERASAYYQHTGQAIKKEIDKLSPGSSSQIVSKRACLQEMNKQLNDARICLQEEVDSAMQESFKIGSQRN